MSRLASSCFTNTISALYLPAVQRAIAIFPLNKKTRGKDISLYKSPSARLIGVRFVRGPDGTPDGAVRLYGRRNSFIQFPNRGRLNPKYSMTILVWIYQNGRAAGPIFSYYKGTNIRVVSSRKLQVRFMPLRRRLMPKALKGNIKPRKWQYVGATYDGRTGVAKLFLNGKQIDRQKIGRFLLATQNSARLAIRGGGKVSCLQFYGRALTSREIAKRAKRCFRSK